MYALLGGDHAGDCFLLSLLFHGSCAAALAALWCWVCRKHWENHTRKTLNQLLVEMDGFEANEVSDCISCGWYQLTPGEYSSKSVAFLVEMITVKTWFNSNSTQQNQQEVNAQSLVLSLM